MSLWDLQRVLGIGWLAVALTVIVADDWAPTSPAMPNTIPKVAHATLNIRDTRKRLTGIELI